MSVQVIVPTRGAVRCETVAMIEMICRGKTPPVYFGGTGGPAETKARAVKWFLEASKADYLLMLDDDIIPPMNFMQLERHALDIVAAVCPLYHLNVPQTPFDNAFKAVGDGYSPMESGMTGLQEVDAVGGGALCIRREVLEKVKPAFVDHYDKWGVRILGEDFHFCRLAKIHGYKVFMDFDVRCDHVKSVPLSEYANRVLGIL